MPSILKQFSIEDDVPKEEIIPKQTSHDYLQQKYVTHQPVVMPAASHKKTKRIQYKDKVDDGRTNRITKLLTSPYFSPRQYLLQLPTLFLGVICYYVAFIILKNVQPGSIQDSILANSYFPLLFVVGLGDFFFFWYVLQNMRRSFLISALLTVFLSLRIHHLWSFVWIFAITMPLLSIELLLTYRSFRR